MNVLESRLIHDVDQWQQSGLSLRAIPPRIEPKRILMCEPRFFEIKDSKNPFMDGHLNSVDLAKAQKDWQQIRTTFEDLGYPVEVMTPVPGLEDMVFTANQVLQFIDGQGERVVVLAEMKHESRRREVLHFAEWFAQRGYVVRKLNVNGSGPRFEGQGDAIWHPRKNLLWGGFGFRTEEQAYDKLVELVDVPILKLRLVDPTFYHLDTAFCALDERSAMVYAPAFAPESLALIKQLFEVVLEVSEVDATNFACNAVALGKKIVLQRGSAGVCKGLIKLGFEPVEVDTSEFMKSGGSVFCIKMQIH